MIRWFAQHPTAANVVMLVIVAAGLATAPALERETFPRIEPSEAEVRVVYPGARPEDVETAICLPLEQTLEGVDGLAELRCEAGESLGRMVVQMREGEDLDRFTDDVTREVEAITDFPEVAERPTVSQLGRTDFVTSVAVTGAADAVNLRAYAEDVAERMRRAGSIPKVEVKGFSDQQLRVEVTGEALRRYGLGIDDVANAVERQNIDMPAGSLLPADGELVLRFADTRRGADALGSLVVAADASGGVVRLTDIARITEQFEDDAVRTVFNGKRAAILNVTKTPSDDSLNVLSAVREFVAEEQARAPPGVRVAMTNDRATIVRERLDLLLRNGAQGLALVLLSLWVFFGLRYALWVGAGLPVSFLGAVVLMVAAGYTINMMTMVGLLIVVGLLMDDAIVIAENIAAHHARGKPPMQAAADGAAEVVPSVFASFVTTACVFGSLAFLRGDIGQVLRVVPVVMLFVLVVSLVEAFLVLPSHLGHALASGDRRHGRVQRAAEAALDAARRRVIGPLATLAVRARYLTLGTALGLLACAVALMAGGAVKFSPFPALDGDVMEARVLLPQGTPAARTEAVVSDLLATLQLLDDQLSPQQPDGEALVRNITVKYGENADAGESGEHVATVVVDILGSEQRSVDIDDVIDAWRARSGPFTDVIDITFTEPSTGPAGVAIEVRLAGDDLEALGRASLALRERLRGYAGVTGLRDDLRPGKPEVRLTLLPAATTLGLDARRIAEQLRVGLQGSVVDEVQVHGLALEVDIRLAATSRDSFDDLDYFSVTMPDGARIPLGEVARLEYGRGVSRIERIDGERVVTVIGDVDANVANSREIVADAMAYFEPRLRTEHPGVRVYVRGENAEAASTQASMLGGFALGLVGVFAMLSLVFRSYVEPLVVMAVIPFALTGAIAGHWLLGIDFTMPSMLGFVALAGVVVNDSILLVNFIKRHRERGESSFDAAIAAANGRFRAVLLTSVTTVAGLVPLLLETSLQAQVLIPLVTSLAFGLVATTVLVLFVVPATYAVLDDVGLARSPERLVEDSSQRTGPAVASGSA